MYGLTFPYQDTIHSLDVMPVGYLINIPLTGQDISRLAYLFSTISGLTSRKQHINGLTARHLWIANFPPNLKTSLRVDLDGVIPDHTVCRTFFLSNIHGFISLSLKTHSSRGLSYLYPLLLTLPQNSISMHNLNLNTN